MPSCPQRRCLKWGLGQCSADGLGSPGVSAVAWRQDNRVAVISGSCVPDCLAPSIPEGAPWSFSSGWSSLAVRKLVMNVHTHCEGVRSGSEGAGHEGAARIRNM